MTDKHKRRVVITGLGVVAPIGIGKTAYWHALSEGTSGISHLTHLTHEDDIATDHIKVAGIVHNFLAEEYIDHKTANRTDRMTHFAFAAIQEAITDARLELAREQPERVGAVIANTMGGVNYVLQQLQALYIRGPRFMSAYTAIAWLHVANVGQTAIRYGIRGYCKTPVNDTVGGLDALGMAYTAIQRGAADVIIAGGCEAFLNPFILLVLAQQGLYLTTDDVNGYRPFDRRAAGLIVAEGAGMCILEDYEHAHMRGATIYGEIVGYGQSNDAHGLAAPSANGTRYARAIQMAMREGEVQPEQVAYISADGRATASSDQGELAALHLALGEYLPGIPISVPRTTFGHSYAAAGALDTITALLALRERKIPPTINCEEIDHPSYSSFNLIRERAYMPPQAAQSQREVALIGGRGVGGVNAVLALATLGD
ncbi:MAG: beta-ketoacyl-ACP synthase II [Ktedonobacteraceae bacterium]